MHRTALYTAVRTLPNVSTALTAMLLGFAVLQPTLVLGFALAVGNLVDVIPLSAERGEPVWVAPLVLVGVLYVAQTASASGAAYVEWKLGELLNDHLDDRVMAMMLAPGGIAHLENSRVRDLATQAADGLGTGWWRPTRVPAAVRGSVSGGLTLIIVVVVVSTINWWLGALILLTTTAALWTVIRHSLRMILDMVSGDGEAEFRRLEYERDTAVSPRFAKEVRVFGFGRWALDRWQVRLTNFLALDLRKVARASPALVISVISLAAVTALGFVLAARQVANQSLTLESAVILAQMLLLPLGQFGPGGQAIINLVLASRPLSTLVELRERLDELERLEPTHDREPQLVYPSCSQHFRGFRLEGVHFRYPGSDREILQGVDLDIPHGKSVAIVGLNGAGKTTLVKLLCQFYTPSSGSIKFDGEDIRAIGQAAWQRQVAAIFQDFARYPSSLFDNLHFGALEVDRESIMTIAASTGVDTIAGDLPDRWDTILSREFNGGMDLSGGQWQKVALTRALVAAHTGTSLLILDEPAANLDTRAEAELNERFLELTERNTTVLVSHRLSTVRQADAICVLDEGKVRELGSHEELLAAGGSYAKMFHLQAERFRA